MNDTTMNSFTSFQQAEHMTEDRPQSRSNEPALVIQILSVIGFGIFSIVAVSLAFAAFWVAGLIVAGVIAATWARSRMFGGRRSGQVETQIEQTVRTLAPSVSGQRSTGNASFDTYREEVLRNLEQESRDFEGFLSDLRTARDESEFDQFLDERAKAAKELPEN